MENGETDTPPAPHRTPPVREECWTEEATETLVEAWGERFLELNRGNLRQHHWQEVADAINARHGHVKKHRRTDIQCKNRLDTLKKKYKVEKARVSSPSQWRFFSRLDHLIGPSYKPSPSPAPPSSRRKITPTLTPLPAVPVGPRSKRPSVAEDSYQRWNPNMVDDSSESGSGASWQRGDGEGGYGEVAVAIERLGEIYQRVEGERQRQMVELEKQRMKFAKDLEIQRMKLFMESQIQMEKIRLANRNNNSKRARHGEDDDDGQGFLSSFYCLFNL